LYVGFHANNSPKSRKIGTFVDIRVIKFGEFSPIGRLFSLGRFFKLQKEPKF
jgi:hypothetical protein